MRRPLCLVAMLAAAAGSATVATGASFTARTSNPDSTFTAAAVFCPGTQTVTLAVARDSWIDQQSPTATHGADTSLTVTSRGTRNARALVGFALPAAQGCQVTAATLRLTTVTASSTTRTLNATRIDPATTWTEGGVAWSGQPSTTGAAATTTSGPGTRTWTVTAQVQAMYAAGESAGSFQLADAAEGATGTGATQAFAAREGASGAPQLVVTFG